MPWLSCLNPFNLSAILSVQHVVSLVALSTRGNAKVQSFDEALLVALPALPIMQRWTSLVQSAKHQVYMSLVHDPFLNLSIEHYLLQKSPPSSTTLFLYINSPCVVIGRNQNPWLEVNLQLLEKSKKATAAKASLHALQNVEIVRRRSGGGAVFHDGGNVNYSVICPPDAFTRDKHAEMVSKAIRTFNDRARVNERHDIVLDVGPPLPQSKVPSESDMHKTRYSQPRQSLKISGSAYKIIRNRCLHHGTCLVASPNLSVVSQYLRSPARPFMKAKGVESVPSPVGNASISESRRPMREKVLDIKTHTDRFQVQVVKAFADLYGLDGQRIQNLLSQRTSETSFRSEGDLAAGFIGNEALDVQEVAKGVEELKVCLMKVWETYSLTLGYFQSLQWTYGQTPQFTLSSHSIEEDDRERPPLPAELPASVSQLMFLARCSILH